MGADISREAVERLHRVVMGNDDERQDRIELAMTAIALRDAVDATPDLRDVVRELVAHLRDFADTKFDAIRPAFVSDPQDEEDPVTELWPVEAWQSDARAAIAKAEGVL